MTRALTALLAASLLAACPLPIPTTPAICARARDALQGGDTLALFKVARDVYRRHGAEFDAGLVLLVHGEGNLSAYYREDSNRIVLASGAKPGGWPAQLRALSMALRYADEEGFPRELAPAEAAPFVNLLVLLFAAHEQAHYLRAQYFNPPQDGDHFESERVCNRLGVAVLKFLAAHDPAIAERLQRAQTVLETLLRDAPAAVSAYPPPGEDARAWFNRHYSLLLRREPGVYFTFQLRWWLEFLRRPSEPLEPLVKDEITSAAQSWLADALPASSLRVSVRTTPVTAPRLPSEVLAVSPTGELLIDVDGRLLRIGDDKTRTYTSKGLPYGDGYRSNYATWPGGDRLYAFRWEAPKNLLLYEIALDDRNREARSRVLHQFESATRVVTLSHDPNGALYVLARGKDQHEIHRVDLERRELVLWRRIPRRPAGHRDGPIEQATYDIGAFAVTADGALVFADPRAFALRRLDEDGMLTTLFGTLRGLRDGDGEGTRTTRPSHLAAHASGFFFLEPGENRVAVRSASVRARTWRSP